MTRYGSASSSKLQVCVCVCVSHYVTFAGVSAAYGTAVTSSVAQVLLMTLPELGFVSVASTEDTGMLSTAVCRVAKISAVSRKLVHSPVVGYVPCASVVTFSRVNVCMYV